MVTADQFHLELERLRTQWPNSYGKEREALLFRAFRDVNADELREAVTDCLSSCRQAPLVAELTKAVEAARNRSRERRWRGDGGLLSVMERAAENNRTASPEHVRKCVELVRGKIDGRLTATQFDEGVRLLEIASGLRRREYERGK